MAHCWLVSRFFFLGLRQPEIETFLFNTLENFNIFNGVFILSMYVEVALKYWNIFSTCFKFETELCSIFIRDFLLRKMYKENGMLFVLFEYKNIYVELTGNWLVSENINVNSLFIL